MVRPMWQRALERVRQLRLARERFVELGDPLVRHLIVIFIIRIEVLLARHSGHGEDTAEQCNEAAGQHGGRNGRARRLQTGGCVTQIACIVGVILVRFRS